MNPSDLATVIYSYTFVMGAVGSVLWFVAKKAIKHVIEDNIAQLKTAMEPMQELKPNHGSSLNDKINLEIIPILKELRANQKEIAEKVAYLEGRFDQSQG